MFGEVTGERDAHGLPVGARVGARVGALVGARDGVMVLVDAHGGQGHPDRAIECLGVHRVACLVREEE